MKPGKEGEERPMLEDIRRVTDDLQRVIDALDFLWSCGPEGRTPRLAKAGGYLETALNELEQAQKELTRKLPGEKESEVKRDQS